MRPTLAAAAVCAALIIGSLDAPLSGATGPIPLDCNRACLEGVIDQYLAAVVAQHRRRCNPLQVRSRHTLSRRRSR